MTIFMLVIAVATFLLMVTISSVKPARSNLNLEELKRRAQKSSSYKAELNREELLPAIETLLRMATSVLFVILIALLITIFGWWLGIFISLIVVVIYPTVSRLGMVVNFAESLYKKVEPKILSVASRFNLIFKVLRDDKFVATKPLKVSSREEFTELVKNSTDILTQDEKTLITASLDFSQKLVDSVMTPRSVINFIEKREFLGPLVLSELHNLGHSRLPVVDKDLDHVIGILHLRSLLSLDEKKSTTAESAMDKKVFYIGEKDTLEKALKAFLKTRHHLFIVINDRRETVGLLTLEDTLEALIGRRIIDEDDVHEDLRLVAKNEGQANNNSAHSVDL